VLVVQNDPDKSLGRIADGLVRTGVQLDVRSPDRALPSVLRYAGLVVLPGLADPVDEDAPIERVRGTIKEALREGLPILGLCLGGQLLVQELGGSVYPCRPELGFREVIAAAGASSDPLLGGAPEQFSVFHAHAFAFEPPAGAEILLTNDVCVQACRHGDTWAFQCHPETSPEWVTALAAGIRGEDGGLRAATTNFFQRNGVAPEQLERDAESADPALRKIADGIARGFAAQLARRWRTVDAAQASPNHPPER
jgi:GMP synthase-like glutamine amidotransferase